MSTETLVGKVQSVVLETDELKFQDMHMQVLKFSAQVYAENEKAYLTSEYFKIQNLSIDVLMRKCSIVRKN